MSKSSEHNLEDKFFDYAVTPSDDLWMGVQSRVPGMKGVAGMFDTYAPEPRNAVWNGIAGVLHPNRKRRFIAWWMTGAAAFVILALTASLWNGTTETPGRNLSENIGPEANKVAGSTAVVSELDFESPSFENTSIANNDSGAQNVAQTTASSDQNIPGATYARSDLGAVNSDDSNTLTQVASLPPTILTTFVPEAQFISFGFIVPPPNFNGSGNTESESDWAMLASVSPFLNSPTGTEPAAYESFTSNSLTTSQDTNTGNTTEEIFTDFVSVDIMSISDAKLEENYSPPVSFGGQVVALNGKRVSVGTGFELTWLRGSSSSTLDMYETRQTFNQQYLGIPLFAEVKVLDKEKFVLYARGGAQYDFGLRSLTRVRNYEYGELTHEYDHRFRPGNQASLIGGAGGRMKLTDKMSFYLEGNARTMIYQASANLWSQRNVWPGAAMGLRFDL